LGVNGRLFEDRMGEECAVSEIAPVCLRIHLKLRKIIIIFKGISWNVWYWAIDLAQA